MDMETLVKVLGSIVLLPIVLAPSAFLVWAGLSQTGPWPFGVPLSWAGVALFIVTWLWFGFTAMPKVWASWKRMD